MSDRFCALCGRPQSGGVSASSGVANPSAVAGDLLRNITPRTASVLCYVPLLGWLAAIVVLASPRFLQDRTVRFHAFQGLYLFVTWLLVEMVVRPMATLGDSSGMSNAVSSLLHSAVFFTWILMLVKTSQGQFVSLPIIGELADRSVAEQRRP